MGNKSSKINTNLIIDHKEQIKSQKNLFTIGEKQRKLKIVLVGDVKVGKSSISQRLARDQFSQEYIRTVGADFHLIKQKVNDITYMIQTWDIAGEERYRSLLHLYLKDARFIILVLQTTDKQKFFKGLRKWIPMLSVFQEIKIVLGTKIDLSKKKKISQIQGKNIVQIKGFKYYQISAKSRENTQSFLNYLIEQAILNIFVQNKNCVD